MVKYAATCECVLWKTVESLKRSPAIDEIEYKHGIIAQVVNNQISFTGNPPPNDSVKATRPYLRVRNSQMKRNLQKQCE